MADTFRTYPEAAAELRVCVKTLRALVARHRPPVLDVGRKVMFDDTTMTALREAMRRPCPSPSRAAPARRSGGSQARSAANEYEKALAHLSAP